MKWFLQPAARLFVLLVTSAVLMSMVGMALKYTTAKDSPRIQETMAIAVPFVMARGDIILAKAPIVVEKARGETPDQGKAEIGVEQGKGTLREGQKQEKNDSYGFQLVDESYFDSVLFVGDSRTDGLKLYGRIGKADYFSNPGMSVYNLFDKIVGDNHFPAQGLRQLLGSKEYKVIYLMLGINEVGYPLNSLKKQYATVVNTIRELQPNAALVLQGNLGVTKIKASKQSYFSPETISALNDMIAALADERTVFYLPPADIFTDAEGYLRADITGDGVHPYAAEYLNWAAWLKEHGLILKEVATEQAPNILSPQQPSAKETLP